MVDELCMQRFCDPDALHFEQAVRLAREIMRIEPMLDLELARRVGDGSGPASLSARGAERVLDVPSAISGGRRLRYAGQSALKHVNPHVRRKAQQLILWPKRQIRRSGRLLACQPDAGTLVEGLYTLPQGR